MSSQIKPGSTRFKPSATRSRRPVASDNMPGRKGFRCFWQRAGLSGSAAALASAAAAAQRAVAEGSSAWAPLNAVTHCIWPKTAFREEALSLRYTVTGGLIHAGSAVFWATLFESLAGLRPSIARASTAAAATAGIAYVVDYHVVPKRVTPGFEAHLSGKSFLAIYVALGAGLALAALARKPT